MPIEILTASLCSVCHSELDQGSLMSRADRERMWNACHVQTLRTLVRAGLWPDGIPVPIYTSNKPLTLDVRAQAAINKGAQ